MSDAGFDDVHGVAAAGPLKVLFLTVSFGGGGAERFVSNALKVLDRDKVSPSVAVLRQDAAYPIPDDLMPVLLGKTRPWHIPRAIIRLIRHIDRDKPDVLISTLTFLNVLAGIALRFCRHRPIWIPRIAVGAEQDERGLYGFLNSRLYKAADALIAVSQGVKSSLERRFSFLSGRVYVLRTATDHAQLRQMAVRNPRAGPLQHPAIVSMGRLQRQKRYDLLIGALAGLKTREQPHLYLLGEGPERQALKDLALGHGVAEQVHFLGFLQNPFSVLGQADLFVLTSDYEGLSNALVESQAMGLPAVVTDCPYGMDEIIDHGVSGILVPMGEQGALMGAISRLLDDEDLLARMGESALRGSEDRFSLQRLGSDLNDLLFRVAQRRPSGV